MEKLRSFLSSTSNNMNTKRNFFLPLERYIYYINFFTKLIPYSLIKPWIIIKQTSIFTLFYNHTCTNTYFKQQNNNYTARSVHASWQKSTDSQINHPSTSRNHRQPQPPTIHRNSSDLFRAKRSHADKLHQLNHDPNKLLHVIVSFLVSDVHYRKATTVYFKTELTTVRRATRCFSGLDANRVEDQSYKPITPFVFIVWSLTLSAINPRWQVGSDL